MVRAMIREKHNPAASMAQMLMIMTGLGMRFGLTTTSSLAVSNAGIDVLRCAGTLKPPLGELIQLISTVFRIWIDEPVIVKFRSYCDSRGMPRHDISTNTSVS